MEDKIVAEGVNSVAEFLDKYMRHDRYKGRGDDYAAAVLESHESDIDKFGNTLISRHESRTGETIWYYPKQVSAQ